MTIATVKRSPEYAAIQAHYGDRCARRSSVPLMNHIDEGLLILDALGADNSTMRAFAIHPLFQDDIDLLANAQVATCLDPRPVLLTMEYRHVANAYLSKRVIASIEEIVLSPLHEVNCMLIADKVQNRKDFLAYHYDTHPRSKELDQYFKNWLERLGVSEAEYSILVAACSS
jgi:hypothetical protein